MTSTIFPELRIVHHLEETAADTLLAPLHGRFAPESTDLAMLIANGSANEALLEALRAGERGRGFGAVFAADPFAIWSEIATELVRTGIAGVVNYPSAAVYEGPLAEGLDELGLGWREEIRRMAWFRDQGFAVGVVVRSHAQAEMLDSCRPAFVVLHDIAATSANEELVLMAAVRASADVPILLHGDAWSARALAGADGRITAGLRRTDHSASSCCTESFARSPGTPPSPCGGSGCA